MASTHGNKPAIQLAASVVNANAEKGFVDLEDGTRNFEDLIVAGDGVHSELRSIVVFSSPYTNRTDAAIWRTGGQSGNRRCGCFGSSSTKCFCRGSSLLPQPVQTSMKAAGLPCEDPI